MKVRAPSFSPFGDLIVSVQTGPGGNSIERDLLER